MIKKSAHFIFTLSIQFLITLILLEMGLRVLAPFNHNIRVLLYHPGILGPYENIQTLEDLLNTRPRGFKPFAKRDGFVLNSRSFRTQEYSFQKASGHHRIVAIGDSFTAASGGVPHSKHWAVLLERQWQTRLAHPLEVIKLGVGGVGPRFELRLWQLEGAKLRADVVILAFCIGNDFTDEQAELLPYSLTDILAEQSDVFRLFRNLYRLTGVVHSADILVKEERLASDTSKGGYELTDYIYNPQQPTFSRPAFLQTVASRMAITHVVNRPLFSRLFANVTPVLQWLQDSVKQSGAKLVVLLIPDEYQVYPSLLQEATYQAGQWPEEYDIGLPQRQLIEFFKAQQIAYLDLLPQFQEAAKTQVLYRLQDTHWNVEGNQLATEELGKYLFLNSVSLPPAKASSPPTGETR